MTRLRRIGAMIIAFLNPFDDTAGIEVILRQLWHHLPGILNRLTGLLLLAVLVLLVLWLRPQPPPTHERDLKGEIAPADFPALTGAAVTLPDYPNAVAYYHTVPNFGYPTGTRGQNRPQAIVVHVAAGSCAGIRSWFQNPKSYASAHYGVCKDGRIEGYVRISDAAYHAGVVNRPNLSNPLIASWWRHGLNPNLRTVGIETELKPGERIEHYPAMWESLVTLVDWLTATLGIPLDRVHIIGHHEIDGVNRASDPVCCLSIEALIDAVQARRAPPPPPPVDWEALDKACRAETVRVLVSETYSRVVEVLRFCGHGVELVRDGGLPSVTNDLGKADAEIRLAAADRAIWRDWSGLIDLLAWWGVLRRA